MNGDDDDKLRATFEKAGQGHVFQHFHLLLPSEKQQLVDNVKHINLEEVNRLYTMATKNDDSVERHRKGDVIEPWTRIYQTTSDKDQHFHDIGLNLIASGKVAVILLAGGQGTRLGSSDPKGVYDIGLPGGESLFQLQAEQLLSLSKLTHCEISWYIMTSDHTEKATREFFRVHDYFGLSPASVTFFEQSHLPALLSEDGKIAMTSPGRIAFSPNGNGGLYESLVTHGVLEKIKRDAVEFVFVYGVDNVAVRVADPSFLGLVKLHECECGIKVVPKRSRDEKVGVLAQKNGVATIVEYSEVSQEMTKLAAPGNICQYVFSVEFLERACKHCSLLPLHVAHKHVPFYNGMTYELPTAPNKPNGYKFEKFIFDTLCWTLSNEKVIAMQVCREDEFVPLKNKSGADGPETCRDAMVKIMSRR